MGKTKFKKPFLIKNSIQKIILYKIFNKIKRHFDTSIVFVRVHILEMEAGPHIC